MNRRRFLRGSAAFGGALALSGPFHALGLQAAAGQPPRRSPGYGPLVGQGELALPEGFSYQVLSRQGDLMHDGAPTPGCFDGMGSFHGPHGTTILIRNHENRIARRALGEVPVVVPPGLTYDTDPAYIGGCTKLVVDRRSDGTFELIDDFAILGGTDNNCAGGVMPWGSWLTCEEVVRLSATGKKHGYIFEIDASSPHTVLAVPIPGAGRFAHEASVWHNGALYETEDRRLKNSLDVPPALSQGGSCFYRYVPDRQPGHQVPLAETGGVLEALKIRGEFNANMDTGREVGHAFEVEWVTIDNPDHDDHTDNTPAATRFQAQAKGAAVFDRMEGAWASPSGSIFFDCTVGGPLQLGQVWEYNVPHQTLTLIYESTSAATLEGPDNVVIVPQTGDVLLCEDAASPQYIRGLTTDGEIYDFVLGLNNDTEFAGACFDRDGRTLFVNQYGARGALPFGPPGTVPGGPAQGGVTFAITGPFQQRGRP